MPKNGWVTTGDGGAAAPAAPTADDAATERGGPLEIDSSASLNAGGGPAAWETVMTHDLANWDGGSVERLESGHVLVAMTSPYASTAAGGRGWNANYSMMAWEVAPSGTVLSEVIVPHSYDSLTREGGYRMVPWDSVGGESSEPPSWCASCSVY